MSYQEREIPKDKLQKYLKVLDSDEGIRIDNTDEHIFINKVSHRYIVNISKNGLDQFFYQNSLDEVMHFLDDKINTSSKIFSY
jgi:hypothetical protein